LHSDIKEDDFNYQQAIQLAGLVYHPITPLITTFSLAKQQRHANTFIEHPLPPILRNIALAISSLLHNHHQSSLN
jgi:hypothetical protein